MVYKDKIQILMRELAFKILLMVNPSITKTAEGSFVRWGGLEPPRLATHGPQPCLSASSSTSAKAGQL